MLTEPQYKRLPGLLQEIVDIDRELDAIRRRVVVPFRHADRSAREFELTGRRAGLREAAGRIWGVMLRTEHGPGHA